MLELFLGKEALGVGAAILPTGAAPQSLRLVAEKSAGQDALPAAEEKRGTCTERTSFCQGGWEKGSSETEKERAMVFKKHWFQREGAEGGGGSGVELSP